MQWSLTGSPATRQSTQRTEGPSAGWDLDPSTQSQNRAPLSKNPRVYLETSYIIKWNTVFPDLGLEQECSVGHEEQSFAFGADNFHLSQSLIQIVR